MSNHDAQDDGAEFAASRFVQCQSEAALGAALTKTRAAAHHEAMEEYRRTA